MFGLTNSEGNHGEDVKEYWFYLDSTPDALLPEVPVQVSAAGVPVRGPRRHQRAAAASRTWSTSCWTPAIFDEDRYFDVVVEYAKGAPDDILMLVTAHNRGPEAATLHLLPTLWFRNTWSWGDGVEKPAADGRGRRRRRAPSTPSSASGRCAPTPRRSCCSARTRPTTSACSAPRTPRRTSRTRSTTSSSAGDADAVNPAGTGTKVAAHHVLEVGAGRERLDPGAPDRAARRRATRWAPTSTGCWRPAATEADAVLRDGHPLDARRRRGAGDAPGAGRAAVGQAVLRVRRAPLAARARRQPVGPERARQLGAQRPVVPHDRGRRHLDARQVGVPVVRGVGPGLPLRAAGAGRRRLRQGAGRAAAQHQLPAPQRPDPGVRVELQRRQPARHGVGGAVRLRARGGDPRRGRPRVPRARVRAAADELHAGGSTARTPTAATSSRAASSASTTSASSTARRRCPGGGTLEQADGTAWMALYCQWMLQIARRAGASTTPPTPTWRSSSSRTSSGSRSPSTRPTATRRCGTRRTASTTT